MLVYGKTEWKFTWLTSSDGYFLKNVQIQQRLHVRGEY